MRSGTENTERWIKGNRLYAEDVAHGASQPVVTVCSYCGWRRQFKTLDDSRVAWAKHAASCRLLKRAVA